MNPPYWLTKKVLFALAVAASIASWILKHKLGVTGVWGIPKEDVLDQLGRVSAGLGILGASPLGTLFMGKGAVVQSAITQASNPPAGVRLPAVLLLLSLCGAMSACAHLQPVVDNLPRAIALAQDGEIALDLVETAEKTAFAVHPDPDLQAKVEAGISDARTALDAGLKICMAGTDLSQAQIDDAFANFKTAYTDIMALLGPLGIKRVGVVGHGKIGVIGGPGGTRFVVDPILLNEK